MSHTKIGLEERLSIEKWYGTVGVPQMASRLGRNKTSLYDEIRANGDVRPGVSPGSRFRKSDYTYDAEATHSRACAPASGETPLGSRLLCRCHPPAPGSRAVPRSPVPCAYYLTSLLANAQ